MHTRSRIKVSGGPPPAFSPGNMLNGVTVKDRAEWRDISVLNSEARVRRSDASSATTGVELDPRASRRLQGTGVLTLEMTAEDGSQATMPGVIAEISTTSADEMHFDTERQPGPWNISITVNRATRQMTMRFTLNHTGLSVAQSLESSRFLQALARGGDFRIYGRQPGTGTNLPIARGGIPPGTYEGPEPRFMEMLEQLSFIENKTRVSFTIPGHSINFEEASTIAATAHILETGHATYQAEPWVSVSSVDQARAALEALQDGEPIPMAVHFDGQVVVIFDTHVPLGPVTFFCDRTYIAPEDMEALRRNLEAAGPDDTINVRFTPFEGCPVEARYINWLSDEEAELMRRSPVYQRERPGLEQEEEWELPTADVEGAVALLQSWCAEDPQEQEEQRETWEYLRTALDEDRLSDRKLFA